MYDLLQRKTRGTVNSLLLAIGVSCWLCRASLPKKFENKYKSSLPSPMPYSIPLSLMRGRHVAHDFGGK